MGTEVIEWENLKVKRVYGGSEKGVCFDVTVGENAIGTRMIRLTQSEMAELIGEIAFSLIVDGEGRVESKDRRKTKEMMKMKYNGGERMDDQCENLKSVLRTPTEELGVKITDEEIVHMNSTDDGIVQVAFSEDFTVFPKLKIEQLKEYNWHVASFGRNKIGMPNATATFEYREDEE